MRRHQHFRAGLLPAGLPGGVRHKAIFSPPKPKPPPEVKLPPPTVTTGEVQGAGAAARDQARRRKGFASTILTSLRPEDVLGTSGSGGAAGASGSAAPRKTLLGG